MPNQVDNLTLNDDTTGLTRTIDVGSDDILLSTDLTLQAGGLLTSDNVKRGTTDPNVAMLAGNEGDLFQRTLAGTGELYVNTDGTTTGWVQPGGISEATHQALRQLIHFIDDGPTCGFTTGAFKEILPAGNPFPTSYVWYESAAKVKKIVELTVTRNANKTPATEQWQMYDTDGITVLCTVTDAISYTAVFETSRTRTIV